MFASKLTWLGVLGGAVLAMGLWAPKAEAQVGITIGGPRGGVSFYSQPNYGYRPSYGYGGGYGYQSGGAVLVPHRGHYHIVPSYTVPGHGGGYRGGYGGGYNSGYRGGYGGGYGGHRGHDHDHHDH